MKTRSDEASEPCGGLRPATWLQTSCGVQNSRRQISARVSHNWGSSRMLVRRPRTLILRITSALCRSGSPSGAVRRLGRAVAMGAIRTCVAAPDSQPWKAHYKAGFLISGLHEEMFVILAESWRCFFARHTPILMDDCPPITTDATQTCDSRKRPHFPPPTSVRGPSSPSRVFDERANFFGFLCAARNRVAPLSAAGGPPKKAHCLAMRKRGVMQTWSD